MNERFSLGRLLITSDAQARLDPTDVHDAIHRHAAGDWGEVDEHDRRENESAIREGFRLLSAYTDRNHVKFWIISEADRSATTVLLPEDY